MARRKNPGYTVFKMIFFLHDNKYFHYIMELGSSNYRLVEKYEIRTNFFLFRFSLKLFWQQDNNYKS